MKGNVKEKLLFKLNSILKLGRADTMNRIPTAFDKEKVPPVEKGSKDSKLITKKYKRNKKFCNIVRLTIIFIIGGV
tara:strand:+ start:540 stop:767 length:228 start_codon:yes stop_codon:yes gene_type:complete